MLDLDKIFLIKMKGNKKFIESNVKKKKKTNIIDWNWKENKNVLQAFKVKVN